MYLEVTYSDGTTQKFFHWDADTAPGSDDAPRTTTFSFAEPPSVPVERGDEVDVKLKVDGVVDSYSAEVGDPEGDLDLVTEHED